ncbi:MAG: DNA topoisomerase III [Spartobacteria bacterium]|nr:DNA topoisomerase III [Spartobacteria bacterium]
MKVIVTEKPSVARDIAAVWGIKTKKDGYYEGRGCAVTWAFGHLVTLLEPGDYTPELKKWSLGSLPFIPDEFKLKLIDNKGVKEQFEVIRGLFGQAVEIICATDAGREGELIFRYLLSLAGCEQKPFRRLWLSSMTTEAIKEAFGALKDGHAYDNLYAAARNRSESDWIVGLNATRCFTVRYGRSGGGDRVLWSVGRVQTPVLAMIVERDDEILNFVPQPFWELATRYREVVFKYTGKRFEEPAKAEALLKKISDQPFVITGIKGARKKEKPPQLYDLTTLQRDMNKRHGLSAAQTLQTAQKLYEEKLLTYPRTDSRYIGKDMQPRVVEILKKLTAIRPDDIGRLALDQLPFTKSIVDDKKVTDHHAIIPTGVLPHGLAGNQLKVYEAVLTQFIAAFYPDCVKEITTVSGESNTVKFEAKGTRIIAPGWSQLYPKPKKKDDDQELPEFQKGETGPHAPFVREGQTKPPNHFTENSLLAAMESAGKLVEDDALREALKEKGLGTPATRAAVIETLLNRNYIKREKRQLQATDMGRFLISLIQDDQLKSPEMTGEWEEKLKKIERGLYDASQFMKEISEYTTRLVKEAGYGQVDKSRWGACPKCGSELMAGKKGIGCSRWKEGCDYVLWREYNGVPLSDYQLQELSQLHVLLNPVNLPEKGRVVLRMDKNGHLMELACPKREKQKISVK